MELRLIKDNYYFLVLGDSISRGIVYNEVRNKYVPLKENYVSLLQNQLKGMVNNLAKFGNTLIRGTERLQRELFKTKPDIVLLEFGGNDCDFNWPEVAQNPEADHKPNTDYEVFKDQLRNTIQSLKNINIIPVLMTLPPLDPDRYFKWISQNSEEIGRNILKWLGSVSKIYWWQEKYNAAILTIASQTGTNLIDVRSAFLDFPDFRSLLCPDGIHPNEKGHQVIAQKIYSYVKENYPHLLRE